MNKSLENTIEAPQKWSDLKKKDKDTGTYVLIIKLAKTQTIKPGKLPEARYEKGIYLYIGRARIGLRARVGRHLRSQKKIFWHIDYLLQKGKIEEVWVRQQYFGECLTAARLETLLPSSLAALKGFGSSDCRCSGHLFYFSDNTDGLPRLQAQLGFRRIESDGIRL